MKAIEPVIIKLDREREIVLDIGALMLAERKLNLQRREDDLPPTNIWHEIFASNVSMQVLTCLLWGVLHKTDPLIHIDEVPAMIRNPVDACKKMWDAIQAHLKAVTDDDEEVGDAKRPLDRLNGSSSVPASASSLE